MDKIKIVDFFEMNNFLVNIFSYLALFGRKSQFFIFNNVFLIKIKTVRFFKKWSKENLYIFLKWIILLLKIFSYFV